MLHSSFFHHNSTSISFSSGSERRARQTQPMLCGLMKKHCLRMFIVIGASHQFTRDCLAKRERVITAQGDPICADKIDQVIEHFLVMNERVEIHPAQIITRVNGVINPAEIGTYFKSMLDPTDGTWKRAAAVRE